jgi:hypothetical protein
VHNPSLRNISWSSASISEAGVARRYFAAGCFLLASARRSVFFRRLARFLALSLPLLFPISFKTRPLAPSRHVVVSPKTGGNSKSTDVAPDETEAGVCAVAAFDAIPTRAHPELA